MQHKTLCAQLAQQVIQLHQTDHTQLPELPGVRLLYSDIATGRTPVMYKPGIVMLFQGQKRGYIGRQIFNYDATKYLMLTIPLPFECETFATPAKPLAGMVVHIDMLQLQALLSELEKDDGFCPVPEPQGIHSAFLTSSLLATAGRLLEVMAVPREARVLGPGILREILYYVLTGPCGGVLISILNRYSQVSQISRSLQYMELHYTDDLRIEMLARQVNLSVSAFHHLFRAVTHTTPLQYLKALRLHQARVLMLQGGQTASAIAIKVGYESASQFSREFKRYFGITPGQYLARWRTSIS